MFDFDEKYLYPLGRPPAPPHEGCGHFSPGHPHFTMTEEMEKTMCEMRRAIQNMVDFEKRIADKYEEHIRTLTADNVLFKKTFADSHAAFIRDVQNEINVFEGNMNAVWALFESNIRAEIGAMHEQQNTVIANAVQYMKDNLASTLGDKLTEMENDGTLDDIIDAALNVHNVKHYGAKGDGVTDDTNAIATAVATVGRVEFPSGTYLIDGGVINLPDNCVLEGKNFKGVTFAFKNDSQMTFKGTSILNDGKHAKHLNIRGIQFRKESGNLPVLELVCCDYVKVENCWFYGEGKQVLLWECFDSRFMNTDFEWGGIDGNKTVMGVELRSGDGGLGGIAYEYTNSIYFIGCRFESHKGVCVGSTGNNTNKIVFAECKFESFNVKNCNAIRFVKAVSVYFRDCFFMGVLDNTANYVYIDQTEDIVLCGYGDHRTGTYSGKKLFYVSGSRNIDVCLNINPNGAYTISDNDYGFDTYDPTTYVKMRIKVNAIRNDLYYVGDGGGSFTETLPSSQDFEEVVTLDMPSNGYLLIKGAGGLVNGEGYIEFSAEYSGLASKLTSYNCGWVSICIPVAKGERVGITTMDIAEGYAVFRPVGQAIH